MAYDDPPGSTFSTSGIGGSPVSTIAHGPAARATVMPAARRDDALVAWLVNRPLGGDYHRDIALEPLRDDATEVSEAALTAAFDSALELL